MTVVTWPATENTGVSVNNTTNQKVRVERWES